MASVFMDTMGYMGEFADLRRLYGAICFAIRTRRVYIICFHVALVEGNI